MLLLSTLVMFSGPGTMPGQLDQQHILKSVETYPQLSWGQDTITCRDQARCTEASSHAGSGEERRGGHSYQSRMAKGLSVAQSRLTLLCPMDCSLPGSSVHGILQGRILEWVAIPFSRGSSPSKDRTQISCIAGRFFTIWTGKPILTLICTQIETCCLFCFFNLKIWICQPDSEAWKGAHIVNFWIVGFPVVFPKSCLALTFYIFYFSL